MRSIQKVTTFTFTILTSFIDGLLFTQRPHVQYIEFDWHFFINRFYYSSLNNVCYR